MNSSVQKCLEICMVLIALSPQPAVALHKVYAGVQRYGDVIIIRNADGSIESRDATAAVRGPAKRSRTADFSKRCKSKTALTKYGGRAAVKEKSQTAAKHLPTRTKSMAKARPRSHSSSPHTRFTRDDDVVIIHNADGSIEARDAQ